MAVLRIHKTSDYTVMSNYHLFDKRLSLKAKGLLSVMLALPDTWEYSIDGLVRICKEKETAIISALNELKECGYLEIVKLYPNMTKSGKIEYLYNVYETPFSTDKSSQDLENQDLENQAQLNTYILNTNNQDKIDKKKKKSNKRKTTYEIGEQKLLTEYLIDENIIPENDINLDLYNEMFEELVDEYGLKKVRSCLYYVISQLSNRNNKDEMNNDIENMYGYIKKSLLCGLKKLNAIERMKNNE